MKDSEASIKNRKAFNGLGQLTLVKEKKQKSLTTTQCSLHSLNHSRNPKGAQKHRKYKEHEGEEARPSLGFSR